MDADQLQREVRRFDPEVPLARAWMPPSSWYVEPAFGELERRAIFHRTWQPVARLEQLTEAGSYVSGNLVGEPWVCVRDGDRLRAFHNVCRHKGREVVTGAGRCEQLVCGYHAWAYGLDGCLRSAPRSAGMQDFDRAAMSLPPIQVETFGPWVMINLDPDARPHAGRVPGLLKQLEEGGWGALRFHSSKSWDIACNWKVYVDNYLDGGYHIPHMHPSLAAQIDMETYRTELHGEYSLQSSGSGQEQRERIGGGPIYAWLFPNVMLNRYGPCLDTNLVLPRGPDRCEVRYEFYFEPHCDDEFIAQSIAQADVTQAEDVSICESVQRGLASSSYDAGRYAPAVENGEHHFHRLLAAALGSSAAPPAPGGSASHR